MSADPSPPGRDLRASRRGARARRVLQAVRAAHARGRTPTPPALGTRAQRTRLHVLDAARRVFVDKGFDATTIGDITAAAGISRAAFYQYFADRFDVMACLVGGAVIRALEEMSGWDASTGRIGLRRYVAAYVRDYAEGAAFRRVWEEVTHIDPELAALRRGLADVYAEDVADELRQAGAAGLVRTDRYCYDVFVAGGGGAAVAVDDAVDLLTVAWADVVHLREVRGDA